jgi:nucleotide-binding universal stress UspA family protein
VDTVGKILVPVDFSKDSAEALKSAVSLAHKTRAEVTVMHVARREEADAFLSFVAMMEGFPMAISPAVIPLDRLLSEKALDLYHFIERVVRNPGQLKIKRKVALGNPAEKIFGVVAEERIDLVVLARKRKSLFSYMSAHERLLRLISRCPCPVLLTPFADDPWPNSA